MADKPWPSTFIPADYEIGLRSNVQLTVSGYNGETRTSEIPGSRWIAKITLPTNVDGEDKQPVIEAYAAELRGMANRIVMGHLKRSVPRGTARGTLTSTGAAQGALSMTINASSGGTLMKGDLLGFTTSSGSQLVMVTADTTLSGLVVFSPPLRAAVGASSAVVWDGPTTRWILMASEIMVQYGAGGVNQGIVLDLMEVFS